MTALHFLGAAGTVTGSCYLLTTSAGRLLVDCGMFQGPKSLQALNFRPWPVAPAEIAAVLLTHAHIDHSGLLPRLVADGFHRRVHATAATCDLLRWMLPDSGAIQESEVERLNRRNAKRDAAPVLPLYTLADAEAALDRLAPESFDRWFEPLPGVRARFRNAGHILGAASIEIELDGGRARPLRLLFSGDLGPRNKSLQYDPATPGPADVVVIEATYGDRTRPRISEVQRRKQLADEVVGALLAGGNLIIPAFAVERTQELLLDLSLLVREGRIPPAPVYLDSPLARRATEVFERHRDALELPANSRDPFRAANFHFTESVGESKAIAAVKRGAIIIAGSGMCDAGRVKHHLKDHLWRGDSTVLFVGYQAPGTLGSLIRGGARHVRIHGEEIAVRARIRALDSYSGHADRDDLLHWVVPLLDGAGQVFVTHGEGAALAALGEAIAAAGLPRGLVTAPSIGDGWTLAPPDADNPRARATAAPPITAGTVAGEATIALATGRDWHNEYAEAVLALRHALTAAPDDEARHALLRHVRSALGLPPAGAASGAGSGRGATPRDKSVPNQ